MHKRRRGRMKKKKEGYNSQFGVSQISNGKFKNLSISWDADFDLDDKSQRVPVLNFTPDMDEHDHYHITLTYEEAVKLQKWLNEYVEDVYMYHEGKK